MTMTDNIAFVDPEFCPVRTARHGGEDSHCDCWWDGEACHACGATPMTEDQKREQGMIE